MRVRWRREESITNGKPEQLSDAAHCHHLGSVISKTEANGEIKRDKFKRTPSEGITHVYHSDHA